MAKESVLISGKQVYLNNKELLKAVIESKEQKKMTDKLARMLMLLCAKYAKKGNWVNYTYNSDMQGWALMMLCRTWDGFDPEKGSNPFAFFTQCICNSFIQFENKEKRQRNVRDLLLVKQGLNPSYTFQDECTSDQHFVDDEQDYYYHKETATAIQQQYITEDSMFDDPSQSKEIEDDIEIDDELLLI
jgi:hypothetical protein